MAELLTGYVGGAVCLHPLGALLEVCFGQLVCPVEQRLAHHGADALVIVRLAVAQALGDEVLLPPSLVAADAAPPRDLPLVLTARQPPAREEAKVPLSPAARVARVDPPRRLPARLVETRLDLVAVMVRRVLSAQIELLGHVLEPRQREFVRRDPGDARGVLGAREPDAGLASLRIEVDASVHALRQHLMRREHRSEMRWRVLEAHELAISTNLA
mmetsp:Transcript_34384/g.80534  ORF Transcript_34384/g.80534 Transcript_34384/m.80534 type:complete len:215 (+) Transcript_34384:586-1230(+)